MNKLDGQEWHHVRSDKQDKIFNNIYFSSFAQLLVETYITFGLEIEQYNSQGGEINKYQINYK